MIGTRDSNIALTKHLLIKFGIFILTGIIIIVTTMIKPNINWPPKIPLTSLNIKKPLKKETISMFTLSIIVGLIYLFIITLFVAFNKISIKKSLFLLDFVLSSLIVYSILLILLQIIKLSFAVPRPNFLAGCNSDLQGYVDVSSREKEKNFIFFITSFPSGHTATICYFGLIAILIILMSPISHICKDRYGFIFYSIFCTISISFFILLIVFVSLSRIWDYFHRWIDVSVGLVLGIIFGVSSIPLTNKVFEKYFE